MLIRDPWLRALSILACAIAGVYLIGLLWQVLQEFADIILLRRRPALRCALACP
jgi:hypothetical protein